MVANKRSLIIISMTAFLLFGYVISDMNSSNYTPQNCVFINFFFSFYILLMLKKTYIFFYNRIISTKT